MAASSAPALIVEKILQIIQPNGLLSRTLKGFEPRLQQQRMMANVIEAYNHNQITLIEAGTGTGKSLAYLIPALLWASIYKERTVISTNTITLQEQLIHKDIPHLLKTLNIDLKAVLVKGMSNYLCLRKLEDAHSELHLFPGQDKEEIDKIGGWCRNTIEGSRSELPFVPSPSAWERVAADSEACLKNDCPHFNQCYFFKARNQAQDAQILVANHHLLFSDLARRADLNNYHETAVLPPYKRIILDEAHHIEDIATEFFASRLSRVDLLRTLGKLSADKNSQGYGKLPMLKEKIHAVFSKGFPQAIGQIFNSLNFDLPAMRHTLNDRIHHAFDAFSHFVESVKNPFNSIREDALSPTEQKLRILDEHFSHQKWREEIIPPAERLIASLQQYQQIIHGLEGSLKAIDNDRLHEQTKSLRIDIQSLLLRLETAVNSLGSFIAKMDDPSNVRWIESHPLKSIVNVNLVDAELDVSKALVNFLFSKFSTIILCSATLATNQQFNFIRERLGITPKLLPKRKITEHIYDSPFDYKKQSLLAVPIDMPPPSHEAYEETAFENVWKAIVASHGQAFVLFTSYAMLKKCHEALKSRFEEHKFPVFKQGDDNRRNLLDTFIKTKRAVLFGTDSFWEGVDVVGDALRCVIIMKLPFKVPDEPIIQARTEAISKRGGNPFVEFSVPHAIVKFKQGFGRLIRHKWDRGCIVCLDTRLVNKSYGKLFLNSLPACEKAFMNGELLWPKVTDFYRQTYYFVKQNPFSSNFI